MLSRRNKPCQSQPMLFPFHLAAKQRIQSGFALLIFFLRNFSAYAIRLKLKEFIFQHVKHVALRFSRLRLRLRARLHSRFRRCPGCFRILCSSSCGLALAPHYKRAAADQDHQRAHDKPQSFPRAAG